MATVNQAIERLFPNSVILDYEDGEKVFAKSKSQMTYRDMAVELQLHEDSEGHPSIKVFVTSEKTPIRSLKLVWQREIGAYCRFTGDEWGASNGTSQWRGMDPQRIFPWYVLVRANEETIAMGVMTQCASFASWNLNPSQVTLSLDLRNGSNGVCLNGRVLEATTILYCRYERTPFAAARKFCKILSPLAITPSLPVYGFLSRPHAGQPFGAAQILKECTELSILSNNLQNRPFQIVDCGWQTEDINSNASCGPWTTPSKRFGDMADLADKIRRQGIRPGLSMRLLCDRSDTLPAEWHIEGKSDILDPSQPQVLEYIQGNVRQAADWGYELFRHIGSTTDCLNGVFNSQYARERWHFADQSKTNAEILMDFYHAIKSAMGDMFIYGEDVIGHLGAGLLHLNRASMDAPENDWQRNRHNRINTLAFRICQNENFFTIDPGPLDLGANQKWQDLRQLAELTSLSGSAFIVSIDTQKPLPPACAKDLARDFLNASFGSYQLYSQDWLTNTCPEEWSLDGETRKYHWFS